MIEDGIGILQRVTSGLHRHLGKDIGACTRLVDISGGRRAEQPQCVGSGRNARHLTLEDPLQFHDCRRAIVPDRPQRAGPHFLEPDSEHAFGSAGQDRLSRQKKRSRARRAVIVDVEDRNARHTDAVESRLTAGTVTEHVAGIGLLDFIIADAGVGESGADLPCRP